MISHCGTVWGATDKSYIYAIFAKDFAYIGETGSLPTKRWGSHLTHADSAFAEKLDTVLKGYGLPPYKGEFVYIGICCSVIELEDENKRKFARLAIEDELHREFLVNKNAFGSPKALLSRSADPSSRVSFKNDIKSFAKNAMDIIIKQYQQCNHCLP